MTEICFPDIQVKEDLREHVLARPSTHLGCFVVDNYKVLVCKDNKISYDKVEHNPGFIHCIVEAGSNCVDNLWRSAQAGVACKQIKFSYTKEGVLSFENDGLTIPVKKSTIPKLKDMYNPTIVFGVYMSSTNYNDNEERKTVGKNGLGIKIVNTLAEWFKVETQDEKNGLFFSQTWRENMAVVDPPIVIPKKGKGYTRLTWLPDYKRFGMKGLDLVIPIIRKYLFEIAMITKLSVHMNEEVIPIRSVLDYALAFKEEKDEDYFSVSTKDSEVVLIPSKSPVVRAYTNGTFNSKGGVHVKAWTNAIYKPILEKLNPKKDEGSRLTVKDLQKHFSLFIVCTLTNPDFTSQEKVELTSPEPTTSFKVSYLNKILKWSVINKIKDLLDSRQLKSQKKKLEGPKKTHKNIAKLEDANFAGTSRSKECILCFCEGDSAKTFVVTGIEKGIGDKFGRDFFGILPCGGKILNVRNKRAEKIAENKIIQSLIQALGLEIGLDYTLDTNYNRLRYGSIMIVADADNDGTHIEGLCQNFFHKMFPTILKREVSFVTAMKTPIIYVSLKDGTSKKFYRHQAFKDFADENRHLFKGKPERFKGLGSANSQRAVDWFGEKVVHYQEDEKLDEEMSKAFLRNNTAIRKQWIVDYNPDDVFIIEDEEAKEVNMTCSSFINNELVGYSIANCERSLPNVIDGLKESQRKILFALFKTKLFHNKKSKKVYIVASDIIGSTEYSYGDGPMKSTIIAMAWNFVGSNNIALLDPDGGFGSRLAAGKDAADSRYISTRLQEITPYIFREEDNPILTYIQGDDTQIEPEYYVPVIPLILVNGVRAGIGTGWSSKIPAHNPLDVVRCLRVWIKDNLSELDTSERFVFSEIPEIHPWYQGFTGTISRDNPKRYICKGIITRTGPDTVEITELPIGVSTDKFREYLKDLREKELIKDFSDYTSQTRVKFVIYEDSDKLMCSDKSMKHLQTYLNTTNMVAFNASRKIHKFDTVDEIIYHFANVRLEFYGKRKAYTIKTIEEKLVSQTAKKRFVEEVIEKKIVVYKAKRAEIVKVLEEREYPKIEGKFDYLLKIPIDSFTQDMIDKLDGIISSLTKDKNSIENQTTREMWLRDLDDLEKAYSKYVKKWEEEEKFLNSRRSKPQKPQKKLKRK